VDLGRLLHPVLEDGYRTVLPSDTGFTKVGDHVGDRVSNANSLVSITLDPLSLPGSIHGRAADEVIRHVEVAEDGFGDHPISITPDQDPGAHLLPRWRAPVLGHNRGRLDVLAYIAERHIRLEATAELKQALARDVS
jgi:hypothetical protein